MVDYPPSCPCHASIPSVSVSGRRLVPRSGTPSSCVTSVFSELNSVLRLSCQWLHPHTQLQIPSSPALRVWHWISKLPLGDQFKRSLCQSTQGTMKAWWEAVIKRERFTTNWKLLYCSTGFLKLGCALRSPGELKIPLPSCCQTSRIKIYEDSSPVILV